MIWNSWVLALIIGQVGIVAVNAVAFINALRIIRNWDPTSYDPEQLELERRSELVATIVTWSLLFEVFSLVVFERTTDSLAPFIPGAMCPVGVLGQNPWGYPTLFVKMFGLFVYGFWIVLNWVDIRVEGFPLTPFKSRYTLVLFPYLMLDVTLQVIFFSKLDPSVITSCCGVVFEVGGQSYASSVASLPPKITRWILASYGVGFLLVSWLLHWERRKWGRTLHALLSAGGFFLGMAAVIAFTAPYIYQMPALHCPFCLMKRENYYYGYLVYAPLFIATFFGVCPALLDPLRRSYRAAVEVMEGAQMRMVRVSRAFWLVFLIMAFLPMGYYLWQSGGVDLFIGGRFVF
ncbi:MAG: hypothetical protein DRG33_02825 [Deltaproteobacteria bacterium]|nr:MAG: hypothetical protein DRG33_02825 [Deltaproteobacteria bacterium]HEX15666.1 hypothetical protein [Deltaproteobacteria bacterium]